MMTELDFDIDETLDVTGLRCPLPLLKAKKKLNEMTVGTVLRVEATDPGSKRDFAVYIEHSEHQLLSDDERGGVFVYIIRRG